MATGSIQVSNQALNTDIQDLIFGDDESVLREDKALLYVESVVTSQSEFQPKEINQTIRALFELTHTAIKDLEMRDKAFQHISKFALTHSRYQMARAVAENIHDPNMRDAELTEIDRAIDEKIVSLCATIASTNDQGLIDLLLKQIAILASNNKRFSMGEGIAGRIEAEETRNETLQDLDGKAFYLDTKMEWDLAKLLAVIGGQDELSYLARCCPSVKIPEGYSGNKELVAGIADNVEDAHLHYNEVSHESSWGVLADGTALSYATGREIHQHFPIFFAEISAMHEQCSMSFKELKAKVAEIKYTISSFSTTPLSKSEFVKELEKVQAVAREAIPVLSVFAQVRFIQGKADEANIEGLEKGIAFFRQLHSDSAWFEGEYDPEHPQQFAQGNKNLKDDMADHIVKLLGLPSPEDNTAMETLRKRCELAKNTMRPIMAHLRNASQEFSWQRVEEQAPDAQSDSGNLLKEITALVEADVELDDPFEGGLKRCDSPKPDPTTFEQKPSHTRPSRSSSTEKVEKREISPEERASRNIQAKVLMQCLEANAEELGLVGQTAEEMLSNPEFLKRYEGLLAAFVVLDQSQ